METVEEWRPVVGWAYEVSNTGFVRNSRTHYVLSPMRTGEKRKSAQRSKVRFSTRPRIDFDVAHLVLETFVGPRPDGRVAMHRDDDSRNNEVTNLLWGTKSDNALDSARKNRGSQQRVSVDDAVAIASRRAGGERGVALAKEFGISQQRICDIYKGRSAILVDHRLSKETL